MNQEQNGLLEWTRKQHRFCAKAMLRAISATSLVKRRLALGQTIHPARGSILASPEMAAYDPNPDYFFHWLRDSAIAADALREAIEGKTLDPSEVQHLVDFVAFSLKLCQLDGPSFLQRGGYPETVEPSFLQHLRARAEIAAIAGDRALGEARYNADGSLDVLKWGRPQDDGPALRALAVMRFFSLDAFRARAGEPALALLRDDLDYTLSHWRLPCCDLWEECIGFHYHTRLVQQAALAEGAKFLTARGDTMRAAACAAAAVALLAELDRHFDPEDGVYRGRLTETDAGRDASPPRRLDIAVILATVHAGRRAGPHSVVDPKTLATLAALERLFEKEYRINHGRPANCAPALGRYAGDSYFSGGAYYFSTLGAAQFCFLLAQAAAEGEEIVVAEQSRAPLAALLQAPAESLANGTLAEELREPLAAAALRRGDMFLATVRRFTPASRELAEQFSQYDGTPTSADNLTWSYACFILAHAARRRAARAIDARNDS
ncbi:glycoside hydrolase family 15 protein [Methylocystis sp. B8]|uniref:glycoside hydrolase family 15 protein n=1 Tax=Methylocystis sp. B8 TaxID=544938 RepID=UPI0010FD3038|nr:glycoside hydrolase family 15 protein [Methylocystis sp. B8]TLG73690.1 glucan 1,4-alpha-glucosidase [Methylocystis sp. B8]